MLDRIGSLMDSLRQVSSDVAHDLRTPLSRLYHRLGRGRRLAGNLRCVAAHRSGGGAHGRSAARTVDLADLVETTADAFRPDAEASGHYLDVQVPRPVIIAGDRELLTQALANLVENAMRYTPPDTCIIVSVHRSHDHVEVVVQDNGPGVPKADLPRLTRRSSRAAQSRTSPGNGLGLSLVSAVAEFNSGQRHLASGGPGLTVRLSFPAPTAPI